MTEPDGQKKLAPQSTKVPHVTCPLSSRAPVLPLPCSISLSSPTHSARTPLISAPLTGSRSSSRSVLVAPAEPGLHASSLSAREPASSLLTGLEGSLRGRAAAVVVVAPDPLRHLYTPSRCRLRRGSLALRTCRSAALALGPPCERMMILMRLAGRPVASAGRPVMVESCWLRMRGARGTSLPTSGAPAAGKAGLTCTPGVEHITGDMARVLPVPVRRRLSGGRPRGAGGGGGGGGGRRTAGRATRVLAPLSDQLMRVLLSAADQWSHVKRTCRLSSSPTGEGRPGRRTASSGRVRSPHCLRAHDLSSHDELVY